MNFFPSGSQDRGSQGFLTDRCNFRVEVIGKEVKIFKKKKENESWFSFTGTKKIKRREMTEKNTNYDILVVEFKNVVEVFVSDDEVGKDEGNHILIQTGENQYVSVGDTVFSFETPNDRIFNLYSPTGQQFKFAYAIGENNTYFLDLTKGQKIIYVNNTYLKDIGFLTKNGKSFNWGSGGENIPNMYHWGFNTGKESKKIHVKMLENYN